jgi:hypothetical protein
MEIKIDSDESTSSHSFYNRLEPPLVIFLVDQTASTACTASNNQNIIAELITKSVNSLILNLILRNCVGENIKDSVFISIIGYGGQGGSFDEIRSDYLSAFADSSLRTEKVIKKVLNNSSRLIEIEEELEIWLEEKSNGISPENCNFLLNYLNLWHCDKDINYPESFIIHFCEDEKEGFRFLLNSYKWYKEPYKRPTIIEKLFK